MAKFKRMLAMFLVMIMLVSALPMQALAADGTVTENETVVDGNVKTEVKTQTTTSTDEATGKVTVEVKFTESTSGTNEAGEKVVGSASGESKTVTDSEGKVQESKSSSQSSSAVTNDKGETTKVESKTESKTEADADSSTTTETTTETTIATNDKGEFVGTKTEVTKSESKSESKVDTEKETGADGSTTTTETKTETTTGSSSTTNEGDMEIANGSLSSTETTTNTTIVAPDGTTTQKTVVEGSSKEESWTNDVKGPDVNVTVQYEKNEDGSLKLDDNGDPIPMKDKDGNIIISGSVHDENTVSNGEKPKEGDEEYDYTETTTTTDRVVTGTLKQEQSFEISGLDSTLECPVGPEEYDGKQYYDGSDDYCVKGEPGDVHYREGLLSGYTKDDIENYVGDKPTEDGFEKGYDLTWSGHGDTTNSASAVFVVGEIKYIPEYVKDENGEYVLDENGKKIIALDENGEEIPYLENGEKVVDMERTQFVHGQNSKSIGDSSYKQESGMVSSIGQFALRHENGNYFYAYCMDASTGATPEVNRWYNILNLEDAIESGENPNGYLTVDEAAKIRAIATTGYWGTESGQGSVDSLKKLLKETYTEETVINVRYPGSNEAHPYKIYELIDGLTEAEALAVTQAAIWTYANKDDITYRNNKGEVLTSGANVIGVLSASKYHNSRKDPSDPKYDPRWLNEYKPAMDGPSDARLQALYQALLGLEPIYADGELREDSMVIPNENVISDVALVIKDKDEYHKDNKDNNKDNDVYNTAVNFKLAFVPGEKDEMYVMLMDGNNQPIVGEDGQPIKKLLAAEDSAKTGDNVIKPVNGVYTLTGLKLSENSPFEFDLKLEGTQYLNQGVYIYQAMGDEGVPTREASQTLVGLAKGEQKVVVHNVMTVEFNVDEEQSVVATRVWREVSDPVVTPPEEPEEEEEEPEENEDTPAPANWVPPQNNRLANNTVEIAEEPVPLAAPVLTGDNTIIWIAFAMMIAFAMVAINIFDKKRHYETF